MLGAAHGTGLWHLAAARDDRAVVAEREAKSVSVEGTYAEDITDRALMSALLTRQAAEVAARLRKQGNSGRTVSIKVRLHDFTTFSRSRTLPAPVDRSSAIGAVARELLAEVDTSGGVRLLGVGVSGLADWVQDDLFTEPVTDQAAEEPPPDPRPRAPWVPGMDVVHQTLGPGWVWGAGRGVVTVRFETRSSPRGPVRSFATDDPELSPGRSPQLSSAAMVSLPAEVDPPVATVRPVRTRLHGQTRVDEYDWLRDRDDPDVLAYLKAENAYTEARTEHLAGLRERLFEEIKARTQETDLSVPVRQRGYWYYSRSFQGKEYGASCRVPVTDPDDWSPPADPAAADLAELPGEEVLLDLNELAAGHEFFALGGSAVSPDDRLLAYSTDTVGDERYQVWFLDLATGELLSDRIDGVLGGVTWHPDGASVLYTTVDDSWRADRIWRHRLGTEQSADELIWHETDPRFSVGVGRSRTDRYLLLAAHSKTTSEYRFWDTHHDSGPVVFHPRQEGLEYALEHAVVGDREVFLVLHNYTGADFEIGIAPTEPTAPAAWEPLIGHTPGVRLESVDAFAGQLVVQQRSAGLTQIRVLPLSADGVDGDHLIGFDREVYTVGLGANPSFDQPRIRLGFTSLAVPPSIYDYEVAGRSLTLLRTTPVLGGFDPADYHERRLWATAPDGTRVPISVVHRAGAKHPRPLLLYGYGSYEASIDPYFSIARLSLLDRGAGFAIAHVRGGGELGRAWYDDGKLAHKPNTFTDFVAAAEQLIAAGETTADTLVAEGGSAGGLLMGAVANLAPQLWAGIVAQVPFVDVLTTMLDPSLPLTVTEYDEWGNPTDDPAAYATISSYAPYENVGALDYPPILAETSLQDTRVLYVEPAKWIARLRARAIGRRDFLLRTELAAGHGGVSGRYRGWRDRAFSLAWILDRMGLAQDPPQP